MRVTAVLTLIPSSATHPTHISLLHSRWCSSAYSSCMNYTNNQHSILHVDDCCTRHNCAAQVYEGFTVADCSKGKTKLRLFSFRVFHTSSGIPPQSVSCSVLLIGRSSANCFPHSRRRNNYRSIARSAAGRGCLCVVGPCIPHALNMKTSPVRFVHNRFVPAFCFCCCCCRMHYTSRLTSAAVCATW